MDSKENDTQIRHCRLIVLFVSRGFQARRRKSNTVEQKNPPSARMQDCHTKTRNDKNIETQQATTKLTAQSSLRPKLRNDCDFCMPGASICCDPDLEPKTRKHAIVAFCSNPLRREIAIFACSEHLSAAIEAKSLCKWTLWIPRPLQSMAGMRNSEPIRS